MAPKRKRIDTTPAIKKRICEWKRDHPSLTYDDLKKKVLEEEKIDIGKSTLSNIWKERDKWLAVPNFGAERTLLRERKPQHKELEDALFLWMQDLSSQKAIINDAMLIQKAKAFGEQLGVKDFKYSDGWLQRFKERRGIKKKLFEGEANSACPVAVATGREEMQQLLSGIDPSDVYNMDETGLFFRLGPNYTLSTQKTVAGTKRSKERLTVALCANADGTHKLKPLVIAKSKRPRCFPRNYDPDVHVTYRWNKKAWMLTSLFEEWLVDFDRQMKGRRVVLLLDNAPTHITRSIELRNTRVHFLPPNTTSHIQPMDAGIIKAFKARYRSQVVEHFIQCAEKSEAQTIDIRRAISMIKKAWNDLPPSIILNCWRHVQIMATSCSAAVASTPECIANDCDGDTDDLPLSVLREALNRIPTDTTAEELISVDDMALTSAPLTDDDIMSIVHDGEPADDEENDEVQEDPPQRAITTREALGSLSMLTDYVDMSEMCSGKKSECLDRLMWLEKTITGHSRQEMQQKKLTDFFQPK